MKSLNRFRCSLSATITALTTTVATAVPVSPDDPTTKDSLILWLRNPQTNFNAETGVWNDVSGNNHHAEPVGDLGLDDEFVSGALSSAAQPEVFSQGFSTLAFAADAFDMMVAMETNGGESLEALTIVAVYNRAMVAGGNTSLIRPVGFGSWIAGNTADNYNLGTDPSTRKDNGNIGANSYSVDHPDDAFFIRVSRMNESSINEWFNAVGTLEHALEDTGEPYFTGTDSFYLGDLRVSAADGSTADIEIAEVIVFNTALTAVQIANISEWLQANIGIESGENPDHDEDDLTDTWEIENFGTIEAQDEEGDPDSDTLKNLDELLRGANPNKADTDDDGLNDNIETGTGTFVNATNTGTKVLVADTDGDTLLDGIEPTPGRLSARKIPDRTRTSSIPMMMVWPTTSRLVAVCPSIIPILELIQITQTPTVMDSRMRGSFWPAATQMTPLVNLWLLTNWHRTISRSRRI
jgi:hypothetical protein